MLTLPPWRTQISVEEPACQFPWLGGMVGRKMLGRPGWAEVPSVGAKLWSGQAAMRALVALVHIRQNQGVAVKGQSRKVANGGLSVSAALLSSCALVLNLNAMIR